jgi:hypothetical protein
MPGPIRAILGSILQRNSQVRAILHALENIAARGGPDQLISLKKNMDLIYGLDVCAPDAARWPRSL